MTKQDFIEYLSHPENLNGHSIDVLEKLVQEYPYFQTGRMLYLKNLHNQNSIDYEKNLHITSAYAPGGKVLYNLIKKKPAEKLGVKSGNPEVEQPQVTSHKPEIEILLKEEAIVILQEMSMGTKEKVFSTTLEVEQTEQKDEYDELQLLEKEMLREAYRTSMTVDLLKEEGPSTSRRVTAEEKTDDRKPITDNQYSFNDWLKVVSGQTPESTVQKKAVEKIQKSELIDKFLLEETSKAIAKPKAEFYSADVMAKKSIQDDETFVSETLAGIYLKQGNLPKALRAYEILMVKHSEKIHIFAPLLEKIKKLLKDQKSK